MKTETKKSDNLPTCERINPYDLYSDQIQENKKLKSVNDSLLNALKEIEKESAHLDAGVNKYGDLQISRLWNLTRMAIKKAEPNE